MLIDEDETFRVVEGTSSVHASMDAVIRIVASYETSTADDKVVGARLYTSLQAISPVPLTADEFKEGVETESSRVQSTWLRHDYPNMILKVKQ